MTSMITTYTYFPKYVVSIMYKFQNIHNKMSKHSLHLMPLNNVWFYIKSCCCLFVSFFVFCFCFVLFFVFVCLLFFVFVLFCFCFCFCIFFLIEEVSVLIYKMISNLRRPVALYILYRKSMFFVGLGISPFFSKTTCFYGQI